MNILQWRKLICFKLWTDESAREFIAKEYPWFIETYDNYPFAIQRADTIRYFVLAYYGGTYLDLDDVGCSPHPWGFYMLLHLLIC
jgi:mannosyltransferase OCH1-like enzyme